MMMVIIEGKTGSFLSLCLLLGDCEYTHTHKHAHVNLYQINTKVGAAILSWWCSDFTHALSLSLYPPIDLSALPI